MSEKTPEKRSRADVVEFAGMVVVLIGLATVVFALSLLSAVAAWLAAGVFLVAVGALAVVAANRDSRGGGAS